MSLKNVLILHTGGTFGMAFAQDDPARAHLSPTLEEDASGALLAPLLARVPELRQMADLTLEVVCNIDSSDMTPAVWSRLATRIVDAWETYDGFVIVHGTDTMAFTAAALSFFLASLTKPIVFTGSQRPLSELRTDARANIIDAVELATSGIPEVMVCFDNFVHRGTRATKASNEHMQAFRSVNASPLGSFGVHFTVNTGLARKPVSALSRHRPVVDLRADPSILTLDALPGMHLPESAAQTIVGAARGIVLRGFGAGNLPLSAGFDALCREALQARVPVIMATQCQTGAVSLSSYANGRHFEALGVVSSFDMSFESVVVKLMIFLGRAVPFAQRHEFFATPLAHEVTQEQ